MSSRSRIGILIAVMAAILAGSMLKRSLNKKSDPAAPLKWTYDAGKPWLSSPALAADGTIYLSSETGLTALTPDGSMKWHFEAFNVMSSAAVNEDGVIYFIGRLGLYALNPNGTALWPNPRSYSTNHGFFSPVVQGAGVVYVNANFGVGAVRAASGDLIWQTEKLRVCDTCAMAMGRDGSIFVTQRGGGLTALATDGTTKWETQSSDGDLSSPAVLANGTIVLGSMTHGVHAVNSDGSEIWAFATAGPVKGSPVVDREGNIYFGAENGDFYSLTPEGTQRWVFKAHAPISGSAALASDGTIYFGASNKSIYALKADGTLKWKHTTRENVVSNPTISADGMVYVLDHGGTLYAFRENNGGLMDSAWPKYKHDAGNTGVAR
jgi:hypothetical protein